MKRLGILLSASGLAKLTAFQFLTALAIVALATFSLVNFATGLTPIGLLAAAFLLVSAFEFLKSRAIARRTEISAVWPEAIDSMISGLSAGLSITEALIDLAETGPKSLRPHFDYFVKQLATGKSLASCLEHLKTQFAHPDTDSTIEILLSANQFGGTGLLVALRNQVDSLRLRSSLDSELRAKLGWVRATARLAIAAPWIVVLMLNSRAENASAYQTVTGQVILLAGGIACLAAIFLVQKLGRLPQRKRIWLAH